MNALERAVYRAVKRTPVLRDICVEAYQRCMAAVPRRALVCDLDLVMREGFFFGFHDKTPFSEEDRYALTHRVRISNRHVMPGDPCEFGAFDVNDGYRYHGVGCTRAWNWQTGASLQWIDRDTFAVNDADPRRYVCRFFSITTGRQTGEIDSPLFAVSSDGQLGAAIDFVRFEAAVPGYGYAPLALSRPLPAPPEHGAGLEIIDLRSGHSRFELSLREIASRSWQPSMTGAFHHISHAQFSRDTRYLAFFHRWMRPLTRRCHTRLYLLSIGDWRLRRLPVDGMASHLAWTNDGRILAYAKVRGLGDGYYFFDTDPAVSPTSLGLFDSDGHPFWAWDDDWFVTDSYPDRFREQYLWLVRRRGSAFSRSQLGRFRSPLEFSHRRRVDLHPRLSRTNRLVSIDIGVTGQRAHAFITLDTADARAE